MTRDTVIDIAGLLGAGAISVGVGMYSLPAGIIAAGVLLLAGALLLSREEKPNDGQHPQQ